MRRIKTSRTGGVDLAAMCWQGCQRVATGEIIAAIYGEEATMTNSANNNSSNAVSGRFGGEESIIHNITYLLSQKKRGAPTSIPRHRGGIGAINYISSLTGLFRRRSK